MSGKHTPDIHAILRAQIDAINEAIALAEQTGEQSQ